MGKKVRFIVMVPSDLGDHQYVTGLVRSSYWASGWSNDKAKARKFRGLHLAQTVAGFNEGQVVQIESTDGHNK